MREYNVDFMHSEFIKPYLKDAILVQDFVRMQKGNVCKNEEGPPNPKVGKNKSVSPSPVGRFGGRIGQNADERRKYVYEWRRFFYDTVI